MMKLYFSPSTSSLATHIALVEAGADYQLEPRLLSEKATRTAEYLTINPNGKVPVLVTDNGRIISEVAATLYYIAHKYPDAGLWPANDLDAQTDVISWMSFTASTVHGSRQKGPESIAEAFAITEQKLAKISDWLIGQYSIADIHLFRVYWRFRPTIDAVPGTFPALEAHHDRMLARPAVQAAIEAEKGYG